MVKSISQSPKKVKKLRSVLVISGQVGTGKSTLAGRLSHRFGAYLVSTRAFIQHHSDVYDRSSLQIAGEKLDRDTSGRWVLDGLLNIFNGNNPERTGQSYPDLVIVDAVRTLEQIEYLRNHFGRKVVHIHLTAPVDELNERYNARSTAGSEVVELPTYDQVAENPTEAFVNSLKNSADVVIDTARNTIEDVEVRAAARLGLISRSIEPLVDVVVGGQYGSEGKGNVACFLAPEYDVLMRVGGPNAGHYVIKPDGSKYCHRLLPSGTLNSNAQLLIGPGATLTVDLLLQEIAECGIGPDRLIIDSQAMIITPEDIEAEKALVQSIGSTGKGGGQAAARRILRGRDGEVHLARDIPELSEFIGDTTDALEGHYASGHKIMLEGTQGTALSLYHGSYPHVTSRDCAVSGTLAEAGIAPNRVRRVIMVCRTYPIRVMSREQTSGPMSQETTWDSVAQRGGLDAEALKNHEVGSVSLKLRRVAEFDWVQIRKAAVLNGATDIALTFADYMDSANADARRYEQLTEDTLRFIEELETVTGAPVSVVSTGFHERCIIDRRAW